MCGIFCLISFGKPIDINTAISCLKKISHRGPDDTKYIAYQNGNTYIFLGFNRLSIMDVSEAGSQPFQTESTAVICNGEIYNHKQLLDSNSIIPNSHSDCEVILPLFRLMGFERMISVLDAEFAMVIYDKQANRIYAARDRHGVRPLFIGFSDGLIGFASEMKALHDIMITVKPVNPKKLISIDCSNKSIWFSKYAKDIPNHRIFNEPEKIRDELRNRLINAVKKRLQSDRPIGFLLSGGLDSSLIVAIAVKILGPKNVVTFSIGIPGSPDVEAAKIVTKYLGIEMNHHIVPFDISIGLSMITETIRQTESYDTTTIRASTPQFVIAKYISEKTSIKVLLSGEGSDEIHGSYRYFRNAPTSKQFYDETIRLTEELYMFDNLRTDRTMAGCGLEVRVPYLDFDYIRFIRSLDPVMLMYNQDQMEKQLLRDSFKGYLPDQILYRSKEAFSDAVSSNEVNWFRSIQEEAKKITVPMTYSFNNPGTIDGQLFRAIFEKIYPGRTNVIKHLWLPRFQQTTVHDPSATVLTCY